MASEDPTGRRAGEPPAGSADDPLEPYRRAVAHFGPSFEATLWGSREAQVLRFDIMIELADFTGCTIVDVGCGRGDFAARLIERGINFRQYIGIDGVPAMVDEAQRRILATDAERIRFIVGDALAAPLADLLASPSEGEVSAENSHGGDDVAGDVSAVWKSARDARLRNDRASLDYICFSGSLNTMDEPIARRLVGDAFDLAAQGVVFNFLSNRCHPRWRKQVLGPARRFNTISWLDWAMSKTSRVAFTQDYLDGHDATIVMRHDGGAS